MLRGNRRAIFTAIGIVLSGLFLFWLVSDLSTVDQAYKRSASNASDYYRDYANQQIRETCLRSPGLSEPDCAEKAQEAAREAQRKEQDLAAQNITAWWTKVMGIAAIVGMALSVVGVFLVYTTFHETRRANEIAKEAMVADGRPWVNVTDLRISQISRQSACSLRVSVDLLNIGKTAAANVRIYIGFFENPHQAGESCKVPDLPCYHHSNLLPNIESTKHIDSRIDLDQDVSAHGQCSLAIVVTYTPPTNAETNPNRSKTKKVSQVWWLGMERAASGNISFRAALNMADLRNGLSIRPAVELHNTLEMT